MGKYTTKQIHIAALAATTLIAVCTMCSEGRAQADRLSEKAGVILDGRQLQTAINHPMKYYISLPPGWSNDRTWPVLVAPSAHYSSKSKTIEIFSPIRDALMSRLIIVAPLVINADPVATMKEYRGPVMDSIIAADTAPSADGRDEVARAKFDSEGIMAVLQDVRALYHGEEKVYIAGFSSSTHIACMFLFAHPEMLKGVVINSGTYAGRGVDENQIPLVNSPERTKLDVLNIIGEKDPGIEYCQANWRVAHSKLLSYGHPAAKLKEEIIQAGNPEGLSAGHNWFPTKVFDFCNAVESSYSK